MKTKNAASLVRQPGEGPRRWFYGGGVHTWKARQEETGGAFLLFEDEMAQHRIAAGGLAMAGRGLPHAFKVLQEGTRILCLQTPGSAQSFYDGASEPLSDGDGPNGSGVVDFGRIQASGQANGGIEIIGPPPFA